MSKNKEDPTSTDKELVALVPTKRQPGESKREWSKRIANQFFEGLRRHYEINGNLKQPRPEERKWKAMMTARKIVLNDVISFLLGWNEWLGYGFGVKEWVRGLCFVVLYVFASLISLRTVLCLLVIFLGHKLINWIFQKGKKDDQ